MSKTIALVGSGLEGRYPPTEGPSLISPFELHHSSADQYIGSPGNPRADIADNADLMYVGIASDYFTATGDVSEKRVSFGIATYGEWSTPNEVEFSIYVDTNEDGIDDYRIFNSDALGYNSRFDISDAFVVVVENLHSESFSPLQPLNSISPQLLDTAPYNTNVMVFSLPATEIGLSATNQGFNYYIVTTSLERRSRIDISPKLRYELPHAAFDLASGNEGTPLLRDLAGEEIVVKPRHENLLNSETRSILLLHHHNLSGQRVEVIDIELLWPQQLFVPFLSNTE